MTLFFTIATTNYLPFAVSLLDSVKKYHPDFEVCIGLTDYLSAETISENALMNKYPLLQLHELEAEEFNFITENYNPMQLANSSKVLFARHFLNDKKIDQVIFGDSDMLFFGPLPDSLEVHDIVFTPHFLSPPPIEMKRQELEVLNAGIYNGGFFKLRKSLETERFISWLRERSVLECIYDFKRGYYGEQLWLNFVPLYFKNSHIEQNLGLNVAYWNLHERIIGRKDGKFVVNEDIPLSFFHFSGWDFYNPLAISKWTLFSSESRLDVKPLLEAYFNVLKENQFEQFINLPNYYTAKNKSQKIPFLKRLKQKLLKK